MNTFILVMRADRFWLVGPFKNASEAGRWGARKKNNPLDDPRWQVLTLANPGANVRLVSPEEGGEMAAVLSDADRAQQRITAKAA